MSDGIEIPPFFEGTEKRIEMDFAGDGNLMNVDRKEWDEVVRLSQTVILNSKTTKDFTSYLLSESSLIVYPSKVILKTCGRTVPISSVKKVFAVAEGEKLEPEWLCYSRKNFLAPKEQPKEYASQESEVARCRDVCNGVGDAYTLGPITCEHWLLYDAQFKHTDCTQRGDFTIDVMMYGLSKEACQHFFTDDPEGSRKGSEGMTKASGLGEVASMIEGDIDDWCFAPCGYSANIHSKSGAYATIHVTPQEECSYASFETNFGSLRDGKVDSDVSKEINELMSKVLKVFQPSRFTVTVFSDEGAEDALGGAPFEALDDLYKRRAATSTHFQQDYSATVVNYICENGHSSPATPSKRKALPKMLSRRTSLDAMVPETKKQKS